MGKVSFSIYNWLVHLVSNATVHSFPPIKNDIISVLRQPSNNPLRSYLWLGPHSDNLITLPSHQIWSFQPLGCGGPFKVKGILIDTIDCILGHFINTLGNSSSAKSKTMILQKPLIIVDSRPIVVPLLLMVVELRANWIIEFPPSISLLFNVIFILFCFIQDSLQTIDQILVVLVAVKHVEAWEHELVFVLDQLVK